MTTAVVPDGRFVRVSRSSRSHLLFVAKRVAKMELRGKIVVGPPPT